MASSNNSAVAEFENSGADQGGKLPTPQPPRRACMVSYSFYESDNRVRRYAELLASQGYSVDAVALQKQGRPKKSVLCGVRVFRIQRRTKTEKNKVTFFAKLMMFFLRTLLFLARAQLRGGYDLIHVHSVPDFEVFAAIIPKLCGAKVILDIHDIVPEFYASKFHTSQSSIAFKALVQVEKMSTAFSDHVIVSNHIWEERLLSRSVPASKLTTIMNYPDTKIFRPSELPKRADRFVVLYPGSLNYHQGLDLAIRAFHIVKDEAPQSEFHIYGSGGDFQNLKALIQELGLEDRVLLKGSLPMEGMPGVMEAASIGVVPKRAEGFGNEAFSTKILEFMAMGLPAIIPNTAIDQRYFNSEVVRFFCAGDYQDLASALRELISNPVLRESLANNAIEFVREFSWDGKQGLYLGLVNSLVRDPVGVH